MAVRGAKPKPAFLKLVTGNPGHRPITEDPAAGVDVNHDNGLEPPPKLKARQKQLWVQYIRRAPWLTHFDIARAHMWVEMQAEFEKSPAEMTAARIGQLRSLGSELGLDPSSRARLGVTGAKEKEDPADKYF
jgi:hypothetical protein